MTTKRKPAATKGTRTASVSAAKRRARTPHDDDALLDDLQCKAFRYFQRHVDAKTGLVLDSTQPGQPVSIAAVGFALACYPVGVERGWMTRRQALSHSLAAARFFDEADQTGAPDGVGHRGFFYHFLKPGTHARAWQCELSTIDTALLLAGLLVAAQYFDGSSAGERELRKRVHSIYARIDWRWAQDGQDALTMGWKPETGFLADRWLGYNEAMLLYVLAMAAPRHAVTPEAYTAWTATFKWRRLYGHNVLYAGPLFIHQFSHVWLDLRGIRDRFMRRRRSDYFENSRIATHIHREYAMRNPRKFLGYEKNCWGFTASDGPGDRRETYRGRKRQFYDYSARGAPFGPDDGTISPWASIASLPFAPSIVLDEIRHLEEMIGHSPAGYGFHASFNLSWPDVHTSGAHRYELRGNENVAWVSPWHFALNQGPIVLMIENHRTGMIWKLMRECEPIRAGLQLAGFDGGWLG
ncbi:MAG: hypothetical protein JSS21_04165 [Proteobacteria bacterium]|nr:hypothetical protein [Pseudomonadota bacterium]